MGATSTEKKWRVKIYHEKQVLEMDVCAARSIDVRRLMKLRYTSCTVLSVSEAVKSKGKKKGLLESAV